MMSQHDQIIGLVSRIVEKSRLESWLNTKNRELINKKTGEIASPQELLSQEDYQPLWAWLCRRSLC